MDYYYSKNNKCKCGKRITNDAKSCGSCARKEQIGEKASNYKDGRRKNKHFCIVKNCQSMISYGNWLYGQNKCRHHAQSKGNNPNFGQSSK